MRRSSSSSSTPDTTFHLEEGCAPVVAWSNGTQPPGGFHQVCGVVGIGGGGAVLPGHHKGRGQVGGEVEELAHQEGRAQVAHLELKVVLPVRSLHTWSMVLTLALTVAREEESSPYSTTTQSFSIEILTCWSHFFPQIFILFFGTRIEPAGDGGEAGDDGEKDGQGDYGGLADHLLTRLPQLGGQCGRFITNDQDLRFFSARWC